MLEIKGVLKKLLGDVPMANLVQFEQENKQQ